MKIIRNILTYIYIYKKKFNPKHHINPMKRKKKKYQMYDPLSLKNFVQTNRRDYYSSINKINRSINPSIN